jgi:hypothetical protein
VPRLGVCPGRKTQVPGRVESRILPVRGLAVILDSDLAAIYGVTTAALNQAVKRNRERFPEDFVFQLTADESTNLISQSVTSNSGHGGRRKLAWAFTEHGAIMAASVLSSPRAVEMSVFVVRAFVRLRDFARGHVELAAKLRQLERRVAGHDSEIAGIIEAIRQLTSPPATPRRAIGFTQGRGR